MRALNGVINFSGGEYGTGEFAFTIGDVAVSVKCEPQAEDMAWIFIKPIGMTFDPDTGVAVADDGSVVISASFQSGGGGGGD